ncbi:Retrovirus-related Pol polyprotein from type-1 retrotransposable element R2 [Glycine soja]
MCRSKDLSSFPGNPVPAIYRLSPVNHNARDSKHPSLLPSPSPSPSRITSIEEDEGSECEVSEFGETERNGGEEDDGDEEKCGGEGEGELRGGSTLSPYLFTLILDVLTEQIQEITPRCMLFADDIVLLGESREELNERLETWRRALETHGFRLSRSKSEYMECKFNKRRRVSNSEVKIRDHIIPQVTRFKYLGSVIQDDGEIEGDVNHRIQAGWMKWRKASGVLCDAKVPIKLKGKFYRTAVRPAILYGTECWAVKSQHENKVGVAEMRMLRWMCGKTRQDKIRNEAIRERVGVAPIVEKMVENRLRWFGHVERRPVDSVVRRVDQMERRQTIRGRGRPKKTIREVIKKDLELNDLDRSMVLDRTLWRKLIHVTDPT